METFVKLEGVTKIYDTEGVRLPLAPSTHTAINRSRLRHGVDPKWVRGAAYASRTDARDA